MLSFLKQSAKVRILNGIHYLCQQKTVMLTDTHSHKISRKDIYGIYNIRINDETENLPEGQHIYFSAGIHPWDAGIYQPGWIYALTSLLASPRVVAIGECGFDKNIEIPYDKQLKIFESQISIAEAYKRPLIIHCTGYFNELISVFKNKNFNEARIIHGFRGKPELARQLIKAGFYLSFGEKFNPESVMATPRNKICVESDESLMPIEDIYQTIADIKKCKPEDLTAVQDIFGFGNMVSP